MQAHPTMEIATQNFSLASPVEEFLCCHVDLSLEEAASGMTNDVDIRVLGRKGARTLLS
jgi:hypothetical protein